MLAARLDHSAIASKTCVSLLLKLKHPRPRSRRKHFSGATGITSLGGATGVTGITGPATAGASGATGTSAPLAVIICPS